MKTPITLSLLAIYLAVYLQSAFALPVQADTDTALAPVDTTSTSDAEASNMELDEQRHTIGGDGRRVEPIGPSGGKNWVRVWREQQVGFDCGRRYQGMNSEVVGKTRDVVRWEAYYIVVPG
ncbi:hypothetical protein CPC08DRAFT_725910 [Agrocybe pediades]|nr:hypothetical protein CPC08DRAFT_725910 [Agrocybe pediades]